MENGTPMSGTSYMLELAGQTIAGLQGEIQRLQAEIQRLNEEKASTNGHINEVVVPAEPTI